jgi:FdhD protein
VTAVVKQKPTFSQRTTAEVRVARYRLSTTTSSMDVVAEEVPVALVYNGISHAVMLATPQDLEDFALGFSITEGIVSSTEEVYGIEVEAQVNGFAVHVEVASDCFARLKDKRRSMTGRTGCGLCGSESLEHALRLPEDFSIIVDELEKKPIKVKAADLSAGFKNIQLQQKIQAETGATHASALMSASGEVVLLREDVGRHNALDKLIGAIKKSASNFSAECFVMTTSRASYEMVQKTVSAGLPMLVAISAPTALAVRIAEQFGLTLVGFTREHSFVVYCDPMNRILP